MNKAVMEERTWDEFRKSGLLLFVNQFLHIFGWAIVCQYSEGKFIKAIPVRTNCRGYKYKDVEKAYKKLTKYMAINSRQLEKEIEK